MSPALDSVVLLVDRTLLHLDFRANLALLLEVKAVHHQSHAASLPSSILSRSLEQLAEAQEDAGTNLMGAMLTEMSPLPALACHDVDIIEAHWIGLNVSHRCPEGLV